ncbi:MAG: flagellar biosynthetic protein FliO [Pseudomonadota bacterium]
MTVMQFAQFGFALAVVLILLGGAAFLAQKLGLTKGAGGFSRKRRLALIEVLPIDAKRRAAIVRCDDREHLIILNANSATVIARDIPKNGPDETASVGDLDTFADAMSDKLKGVA